MPTKDAFDPAHPLPVFLTVQAEQDQAKHDTDNASDGPAATSRVFKASVLIAAATAVGVAVLAVGNPMALFAEGPAWLVDNSPPQSTPIIQAAADAPASIPSSADAQALATTPSDPPSRDETAVSEAAGRDPAENSSATSETLFAQFQAWAAEQDAQVRGGPIQPVQDAPAQVVQTAPAPAAENVRVPQRFVQKRRPVHNARAEVRAQNLRRQVRQTQGERAERPPIRDARAQDQPVQVQDTSSPSFRSIFGQR